VEIPSLQQQACSCQITNNKPPPNIDCEELHILTVTTGQDLPSTAALPSAQQSFAKPIASTEKVGAHNEIAEDDSDFVVMYDKDKGWTYNQKYFKELVVEATEVEKLPYINRLYEIPSSVGSSGISTPNNKVGLYGVAPGDGPLTSTDVMGDEGFPLSLRISSNMIMSRLKSDLQCEMVTIVENKTIAKLQISRIHTLLKDIREYLKTLRVYLTSIGLFLSNTRTPGSAGGHDLLVTEESRIRTKILKEHTPPRPLIGGSINISMMAGLAQQLLPRGENGLEGPTEFMHDRKHRLDHLKRQTGFRTRFITAILGGLALVVPMLIMAIHPLRIKTLITASVAVFLFALGLAWKSSAQRQEMLTVTAAYAAVMVMFVGVSGP